MTWRILATTFIPVLLLIGACKPEQKNATAVEKGPKGRSDFFTHVAAKPGTAAIEDRLQNKFPNIEWTVGQAGPAGNGGWTQVEVSVVVSKSPRKLSEDLPLILAELEQYCKDVAKSTGTEVQGQIEEQLKDGKKEGFKFDYKAQTDSGLVRVGPQQYVQGGLLLTVFERE